MRVFLDFEASSLAKASYPIEVGWVFEDGREASYLIRPAEDWKDWDERAAAVHGISRDELVTEGTPHNEVAALLVAATDGCDLFASAPSWDGKWLSVLLRAADMPRHLLRLRATAVACADIAREHGVPEDQIVKLIRTVRDGVVTEPAAHRALADARRELAIFLAVGEAAAALRRENV